MADNMDSSDNDEFFDSPSPSAKPAAARPAQQQQPERSKTPGANQSSRFDTDESREAALRRELEGVRNINQVIEGVIGTLERAKGNMGTVSKTVDNASTLLNTWTRMLSQTEHNQRLILNPNWKGATQDLLDAENETFQKQQEAERRAAEAERRREEARRKAEEDERPRSVPPPARGTARGGRVRGRGGLTRGGGSVYGSGAASSSSSIPSARTTSGIGRGIGSTRGARARGAK
ncbi:DASH complex subunit Duo1-domain-containing protein [Cercophora scortea]|uniref:DASH complex subunit DUO1 n=1 Tax=Cercophora scortea TaxID=314031 RepID=A0AAE0MIA0_9PEZI|nr:DASH complex subunit Duo1-domain-containing protein [Cercophora scortea]